VAPLAPGEELVTELRMLPRRADLVTDRTRAINRLRSTLLEISTALECALDFTRTGPLILISGYPAPATIRQVGEAQLTEWLRGQRARNPARLARAAVAAMSQTVQLPGEDFAAGLVTELAGEVMTPGARIRQIDQCIRPRQGHPAGVWCRRRGTAATLSDRADGHLDGSLCQPAWFAARLPGGNTGGAHKGPMGRLRRAR
jgi:hypothetical protein